MVMKKCTRKCDKGTHIADLNFVSGLNMEAETHSRSESFQRLRNTAGVSVVSIVDVV
jgi:hypothetical protein